MKKSSVRQKIYYSNSHYLVMSNNIPETLLETAKTSNAILHNLILLSHEF